jgi:hypothetical protein
LKDPNIYNKKYQLGIAGPYRMHIGRFRDRLSLVS